MDLQATWELRVDDFIDNPETFLAEIKSWDIPYLEEWVKMTGDLYKKYGEDFNEKELHLMAKLELLKISSAQIDKGIKQSPLGG